MVGVLNNTNRIKIKLKKKNIGSFINVYDDSKQNKNCPACESQEINKKLEVFGIIIGVVQLNKLIFL